MDLTTPTDEELEAHLEALPSADGAASYVLSVSADARSSAADLARAVSLDPGLTARLLKVANAAYYGLSGRVSTPAFAVTVVGFTTVRGIAAAVAAGTTGDADLPEGFWDHATTVAAACALLGQQRGQVPGDAFTVGLLHELGEAFLHRSTPHRLWWARSHVKPGDPTSRVVEVERKYLRTDHATVGAYALATWQFPVSVVEAVAVHHEADPAGRDLAGVVAAADALVDAGDDPAALAEAARAAGLKLDDARTLRQRAKADASSLSAALS